MTIPTPAVDPERTPRCGLARRAISGPMPPQSEKIVCHCSQDSCRCTTSSNAHPRWPTIHRARPIAKVSQNTRWHPAQCRRRLATIDYDLPELIDLLVVTVEAGVGFAASLQIAVERLPGALGDELRLVLQEQSMGLATNDALRNMLARCDTPAVRSFVRSILQGETLGVSIGQIMRNLADEMRKRRRAAAEEKAQRAPIKLLFPLIFLIFPAIFIVLLA